jgi:hypothetical protein
LLVAFVLPGFAFPGIVSAQTYISFGETIQSSITNPGETDNKNPRGMAVSGNVLYVARDGIEQKIWLYRRMATSFTLSIPAQAASKS